MVVQGLFESHLFVVDLRRSIAFYEDVVGLPLASELPERGAAFQWIGGPRRDLLAAEPDIRPIDVIAVK